ncbi:pyruvate dehydrogenase (acetyl-transferring) E1 component subunit alpha [Nesterenkonia salmonea]|uniref:Pyruvate dehydrogenase (Acetyl-transferring) E1 component subunit alpha n=1 Tax=Nesterenkonia salmonea TaxID=1804987 RepID=A0A5R9BD77_9MICC|nr:pyruvate dehydrogenase (acetyl-transferring) E1 component subunit alpha [Nesterenkonia salmonea]TLP98201.1 pyruvate dehydrogenase (acetyl-transferring) E1 component subunit alpha [Nesterenkonia salmonea]
MDDPKTTPEPGHEKAEQASRIFEASRSFGITPEQYMLPAQQQIRMLDAQGTLVPVEQQGTGPGHEYPIPEDEVLLKAYAALVAGRRINDQNYALVRQGRLAVYPSSHGQEACQVGAALCLEPGDWMFPTYRDTVSVISRGVDPLEVMVSFRGDWHCGYDPKEHRVGAMSTPLTTQLLHAVGVAHAAKLRGEDSVVLAMCGDGATSEGDFHEALNFAAVFEVPVVFFVQNNGYAISVPLSSQSAAPSLAHKAIGYGLAGEQVDGNDMVAVLATLRRAVHLARENSMPLLVEAVTYRMQAHTNADDETRYRDREEVEQWKRKDPLLRMQTFLTSEGILDDDAAGRITDAAEKVASSLRQAMTAEPAENPLEIFDHVYTAPTAQLLAQRAQLDDELQRATTTEGAQ